MGLPGKTAGTGQDSQDMRLEGFFKGAPILYIKIQFFFIYTAETIFGDNLWKLDKFMKTLIATISLQGYLRIFFSP
jgi:hypothetical protein